MSENSKLRTHSLASQPLHTRSVMGLAGESMELMENIDDCHALPGGTPINPTHCRAHRFYCTLHFMCMLFTCTQTMTCTIDIYACTGEELLSQGVGCNFLSSALEKSCHRQLITSCHLTFPPPSHITKFNVPSRVQMYCLACCSLLFLCLSRTLVKLDGRQLSRIQDSD